MVSEISQGKTNNVYFHLYGKSKNKANIKQNRNRLTDAENKLMGRGEQEGQDGNMAPRDINHYV